LLDVLAHQRRDVGDLLFDVTTIGPDQLRERDARVEDSNVASLADECLRLPRADRRAKTTRMQPRRRSFSTSRSSSHMPARSVRVALPVMPGVTPEDVMRHMHVISASISTTVDYGICRACRRQANVFSFGGRVGATSSRSWCRMLGGLPHGRLVLRQSGRWTHDITQAGSSSDPEEAAMPADDLRVLQTLIHDLRRLVDEAERKLDAAQQFGHDAQARADIMRGQVRDAGAAAAKLTAQRVPFSRMSEDGSHRHR